MVVVNSDLMTSMLSSLARGLEDGLLDLEEEEVSPAGGALRCPDTSGVDDASTLGSEVVEPGFPFICFVTSDLAAV